MYETIAILAAFVFFYSLTSGGLERTPINGALIFMTFGLAFGPLGLGLLSLEVDAEGLSTLAEMTLALLLFTDASNANLKDLKLSFHIPQRLLLIGLPLTILLGFGTGVLLFDGLTLFEIAILATMLSPTDAALGKAVVTNETVPSNIRESLNVESGLNDGICVPILFVFIALAVGTDVQGSSIDLALKLVAKEIGIGLVVGLGLTALDAWFLKLCWQREWISDIWVQLPVVALSVSCFTVAQSLHGSGYIAAFTGGILFGVLIKKSKHKLLHAAEATGETLALVTWIVFGAAVVGQSFAHFSWQVLLYSVLSLTVIRMLPIYLSLSGMGINNKDKLFLGWFGPRGLASIVFAIIVLNENLPGGYTLAMTVVCTVILSVVAHGMTANPLTNTYTDK